MDSVERRYPVYAPDVTKTVRLSGKGHIIRGMDRSTRFAMQIDISGLMDNDGRPLVEGEEMENILFDQCKHIIQQSLAQARARIPNHP